MAKSKTCPICSANYHASSLVQDEKTEKINIFTTALVDGWTVEAIFPRRVSDDDRMHVLIWMMDYRSNIRNVHPFWDISFRSEKDRYCLIVTPGGCDADMKRTARSKANALFGELVQNYGR